MIAHVVTIVKNFFVDNVTFLLYTLFCKEAIYLTAGERIKILREKVGITQEEFSQRLGTTRNTITNYEANRRMPMDATIKSICREFNVSEKWLRTGEGEMFMQTAEDPVERLCKEFHATELDAEIIRAYFKIDERIRGPFMRQLLEYAHIPDASGQERTGADTGDGTRPRYHVPTDEDIEREVEDFRRRLLLEKRQADTPSPSSADDATACGAG